jgi:hypothetical protein
VLAKKIAAISQRFCGKGESVTLRLLIDYFAIAQQLWRDFPGRSEFAQRFCIDRAAIVQRLCSDYEAILQRSQCDCGAIVL